MINIIDLEKWGILYVEKKYYVEFVIVFLLLKIKI